jgi:type I restriction enzyme, S subunit
MSEAILAPKLRFPEFSGDWEEKKLGEFLISTLREIDKPQTNYLAIGLRSHFKGTFQKPDSNPFKIAMDKLFQVEENDLIVNITFAWEGAIAIVKKNDKGGLVSHRFPTYTFDKHITNHLFFQFQFIQKRFRYMLGVISPGGAGRNRVMSKKDFVKLKTLLPSLPEQQKIASFLTSVDNKIEQLTKKQELLEKYKKGLMQKIFSQEIRFKANDGSDYPDWEEKNIDSLPITISDGNYGEQYPTSKDFKKIGVPFLRANNIKNLKVSKNDIRYITIEQHNILTSGHLKTNDILITTRGELGNIALVDDRFHNANINAQICLLRIDDSSILNYKYLLISLNSNSCKKQYKRFETGTALKQLPKGSLKKIKLNIPLLPEQLKIANFLSSIVNKIEQIGKQLDETKLFKKALLQQMFI